LGIGYFPQDAGPKIISKLTVPGNPSPTGIEWIHDIRDTVSVQHVRRNNARRLTRTGVDNETGLPAPDHASQYTRTVSEKQLVRSNRQFECPERTEIMSDVV